MYVPGTNLKLSTCISTNLVEKFEEITAEREGTEDGEKKQLPAVKTQTSIGVEVNQLNEDIFRATKEVMKRVEVKGRNYAREVEEWLRKPQASDGDGG